MTRRRGADSGLDALAEEISACRRCERLVQWREQVARDKRAAFRDEEYWGRPVPGFGDPGARLAVIGLAPAAHGANRTGRMFTGDRSGDWLYRAMHRSGFASQARSMNREDGMTLRDAWITAPVRCAPPDNKPLPLERDNCRSWFDRELDLLPEIRVYLCLGNYAYVAVVNRLTRSGLPVPRPRPTFGHGREIAVAGGPLVLTSYHPSQQNTFTGRLTEEMFDAVFARARAELWGGVAEQ